MGSGKTNHLSRIAFWLIPTFGPRLSLQALIDKLSSRYQSPSFLPHMTIYSCERPNHFDLFSLLGELPGETAAITLKNLGFEGADQLKRSFYLQLESSGALHEFVEEIRVLTSKWPTSYVLDPHLSLLYCILSKSERLHLMAELSPQPAEICFDELRVVAIPQIISTPADLNGWQTLAIHRFEQGRL